MCLIGYGGFPRFSEIVGIRGSDIKFFDLYVSIFIEKIRQIYTEKAVMLL